MLGVLLYVPDSTYKYPQKVNEVIVSLCVVFMFLYVSLRMSMSVCVCVYCVVVSMNLCVWLRMLRHAPGTSVHRKPKYRMPTCMLGRWHVIAK